MALGYVLQARGLSILRMKPTQGLLGPKLLCRFTLEDPHDLGLRKHMPEPVPTHTWATVSLTVIISAYLTKGI